MQLKRPSSRRRSNQAELQLNLVPMLDALITLVGFLLYSMSFLAFVHIETMKPEIAPEEMKQQLEEKPLQLTVTLNEKNVEIWSPFDRIKVQNIPNMGDGQPDTKKLHEALIEIKRQFLTEKKIVLVPFAGATYDVMISTMDAIRGIDPTDPPLFTKNEKTGNDEPVKVLFPEVIFGNLLGDT